MRATLTKEQWDAYQKEELRRFESRIRELGVQLDPVQLHTGGERYLMSGKKLVLTGTLANDGTRVVIKASSDSEGRAEIAYEKEAHDLLQELAFANDVLLSAEHVAFEESPAGIVLVTAYIGQEKVFTDRPVEEQFFLALRVLEAQEGFHATTYEHEKSIKQAFPILRSHEYRASFDAFRTTVREACPQDSRLLALLSQAGQYLADHAILIDRYVPYLSHSDLAPHNMRISDHGIYLLDHASFHFGNKYEGWARFLNYMLIHSPELEAMLTDYVRTQRGPDDYLSLRLMRIYKAGFLLEYYVKSLARTQGDLYRLTEARVGFWTDVLEALLRDMPVPREKIDAYAALRNTLRTEEETARQREFSTV